MSGRDDADDRNAAADPGDVDDAAATGLAVGGAASADAATGDAATGDLATSVWRRNEIDSPCVQLCVVHPGARICAGCYRTPEEIAAWSQLSDAARAEIKAALPGRAPLLRAESARPSRRRGSASRRGRNSEPPE